MIVKERCKSLRMLSLLLIFVMVFSAWPVQAFAEDGAGAVKAPTAITVSIAEDNTTCIDEKYYGVDGESFVAKAHDENGQETPVTWSVANWNKDFCGIDADTGKLTFTKNSSGGSTSYLYVTATSTIDGKIKGEIRRSINGWCFTDYQRNRTIKLSEDGQTLKTDSS